MRADRWLVTGASGLLGGHVLRQLAQGHPGLAVVALAGRGDVGTPDVEVHRIDLADHAALRKCVMSCRPTHVVHLGAVTSVTEAHAHTQQAERVNVGATEALVDAATELGARLVLSSTDMVFDGRSAPYRETDRPSPLSHYGRTKVAAERAVLGRDRTLVIRLALMYGWPVTRRATTFGAQMAGLRSGQRLRLFADEVRTPLWVADAARSIIELARREREGLIHVGGPERMSRYDMVLRWALLLGLDNQGVEAVSRTSALPGEPRPADLSLDSTMLRNDYAQICPKPVSEAAAHGALEGS
jgi:dTDP-4-dehydrorhamnose reductase